MRASLLNIGRPHRHLGLCARHFFSFQLSLKQKGAVSFVYVFLACVLEFLKFSFLSFSKIEADFSFRSK